jgi:tetratricopeptide (TPR) repeat protein
LGKASVRDEAARSAVNAEEQRLNDQFTATLERSRQRFVDLARAKGWGNQEIGWNLSPDHLQAVMRLYAQGDVKGIMAEVSRQRTARPYDPFIGLEHNVLQALQNIDNATALDRLSADSYSLMRLIPADDVYSEYKLQAVLQAALLASAAREAERKSGASPRSSERSRRAVELWEEGHRLQSSDPSGHVRFYRAMAYASDGDPAKALRELGSISKLLKEDGDFLYACSWILCLYGDYDKSLKFLNLALRTDTQNLEEVRKNHNFADLRKHRQDEFQKLTTPQWTWNVKNGWIFADVSLTNNSAFTLTNVKLVSATDGWNPDLTVEFLRPGETKTWRWVSQPPADKRATASLKCDQTP